jgi:hypothetical protein
MRVFSKPFAYRFLSLRAIAKIGMAGISGGNVSLILCWRGVSSGTNSFTIAFRRPSSRQSASGRRARGVIKWACDSSPAKYKFDVKRAISGFAAVAARVYRGHYTDTADAEQDTDLPTPWRAAIDSRKVREQCARTPSFSSARLRVRV